MTIDRSTLPSAPSSAPSASPAAPTRRALIAMGAGALALAGCTTGPVRRLPFASGPAVPPAPDAPAVPAISPLEQPASVQPNYFAPITSEPFTIPPVPQGVVPERYWRQVVPNDTGEGPGTIVVDPGNKFLYLNRADGTSIRYGIGVGREGFGWSGRAIIALKRAWPNWTPPAEMIARQPELARYSAENGGQAPGLTNPLGARALYLFQDGVDTLYRIHGNPEAASIGRSVSSGCIRMLNHDIIDIYERVPTGTPVLVRNSGVA